MNNRQRCLKDGLLNFALLITLTIHAFQLTMKPIQGSLFDLVEANSKTPPLAERMRPKKLDEFVGQEHIVGTGRILRKFIDNRELVSIIFWGPPGVGKTTLAFIIAKSMNANFVSFSAVLSGIKEIRAVIADAKEQRKLYNKKTILFVDEIHRFNKAQQDAFLHHVEDGSITLMGATTENPSFEVNSALLSRCRVLVLNTLSNDDIKSVIDRAILDKKKGLGNEKIYLDNTIADVIADYCHGDVRTALNTLETATALTSTDDYGKKVITLDIIKEALQKSAIIYDKGGDEHYNIISAFIKSLRGSDPNAALYWMARMLEAGEDPMFIVRRMVIFASEDIGNGDPSAIQLAISIKDALHFVGMPEGWIPLAQCATYLACAPKSNTSYTAYKKALSDVREHGPLPVPPHIRNAPTQLMKNLGYGKEYKYPHDYGGYTKQNYMPEKLKNHEYYKPGNNGFDKEMKRRIEES